MATKNSGPDMPESGHPRLFGIDALKELRKTPAAVFAGMCLSQGWRAGKMVTEREYDTAVAAFAGSPIGKAAK